MAAGHGAATTGRVFSRLVADNFSAAGSPQDWRRCIDRAVRPAADLELAGSEVHALALESPEVCPAPTFGSTITQILNAKPKLEQPNGEAALPPSKRTRERPANDTQIPSRDRSDRRPPRGRPDQPSKPTAATGESRRAGRSQDRKQTPATAIHTRDLPKQMNQASLTLAAGEVPASTEHVRQRRNGLSPASSVERLVSPPVGSSIDSAIARVAKHLDIDASPTWRKHIVESIPRSGQHMSLDQLNELAADDESLALPPSAGESGGSHSTPAGDKHNAPLARQPAEPDAVNAPSTPISATRPNTFPQRPIDSGAGTAAVEQSDATDIRSVMSHQELPPIPRRERASAPSSGHNDRLSAPAVFGELANQPPADAEPAGNDDLETRMKAILDDAARRHGIEV